MGEALSDDGCSEKGEAESAYGKDQRVSERDNECMRQ